jgi:hypothetical protein
MQRGVTWKSVAGTIFDAFGPFYREPFEFVDTNNAARAGTDKPKTVELGRK